MAKKQATPASNNKFWPSGQRKLPFYDLMVQKEDRAELEKRISSGEITLKHLADCIGENDKLIVKPDLNGGGWSIFLHFTPNGESEPVGIYCFRARHLSNAFGMVVWRSDDFDARHFNEDGDDDF